MVRSKSVARENEFNKLQSDWKNKKLKDSELISRLGDLARTSDSPVEAAKWNMRVTAAKGSIFQNKIQSEANKLDALSYSETANPMDVYNRYSTLAKVAAEQGYLDLSSAILVNAAQALNRMKASARSRVAEGRAAARDAADAKIQADFMKFNNDSILDPGAPAIQSGARLTPQGWIIPSESAEGKFITVPFQEGPMSKERK